VDHVPHICSVKDFPLLESTATNSTLDTDNGDIVPESDGLFDPEEVSQYLPMNPLESVQ
jgi:hypothetical protein